MVENTESMALLRIRFYTNSDFKSLPLKRRCNCFYNLKIERSVFDYSNSNFEHVCL